MSHPCTPGYLADQRQHAQRRDAGVSTFIFFRIDEETARFFRSEIKGDFDLQHLQRGHAVYRAYSGQTFLIHTPTPPPYSDESFAEYIRKRTIELYSCALPKEPLGSKEEDISGSPRRLTRHAKRPPPTDTAASR